jgi:hypothetical protein
MVRADSYRDMIKVAQAERDQWRALYLEQSTQHGAAQDMLLREREQNHRRMIDKGIPPIVDQRIVAATAEFQEAHVHRAAALVQGLNVTETEAPTEPSPPPSAA